jgi:hypothetical protein
MRDDRRVAVSFTFDFDAESAWLGSFQRDTPSALSRGAYGATEGVPRILRLLDRYSLPATFFIPGDTAERHPDETRAIVNAGHEIGHHGYLHEPPHLLDEPAERIMLERGLEALQRITGKTPRGYRSPAWELSKQTFRLLEEYGFEYDASQLGADRPYWVEDAGRRTALVEIPSAWELTDSGHFMMVPEAGLPGGKAPSHVEEIWREDFDGMYEEGMSASSLPCTRRSSAGITACGCWSGSSSTSCASIGCGSRRWGRSRMISERGRRAEAGCDERLRARVGRPLRRARPRGRETP